MITVDLRNTLFDLYLTLGTADTENPPSLMLRCTRSGTNSTFDYNLPVGSLTTDKKWVKFSDLPTSIFSSETGQYDYEIYDITIPASPVLIEQGLLSAITDSITKQDYGTDKARGEYKG